MKIGRFLGGSVGSVVLSSLWLVGCNGAEGGAGYVLLDGEARAAGYAVKAGDEVVQKVLPLEVADGDDVKLRGRHHTSALELEPGELAFVHGPNATVDRLVLGDDIDADALRLEGSETAARALAEVLGARVEGEGSEWVLRGAELLVSAASVDESELAEGLSSSKPVERTARDERATEAVGLGAGDESLRTARSLAREQHQSKPFTAFSLVKPSTLELARKLLPASVECRDEVAGTWVHRGFDPRFGEWYVFTLHIERRGGELVGTIRSEAWEGGDLDASEPTCREDLDHWVVEMPAKGSLEGGQLRFEGTSWSVSKALCGVAPEHPTGYNLDVFTGRVQGSTLDAVNNDGGRMIDEPTAFRRTSCQ